MTDPIRPGAMRAPRPRSIREFRRVLGAAGATAVLGVACLVGAAAMPGSEPVSGGGDGISVADIAEAEAQGYGTSLVSASDPGRGGGFAATAVDPNNPAELKAIAAEMIPAYGWGAAEMNCLDLLWEKESDWDPFAVNPSSGAYGIPQSWPAEKLATAGDDWRTNPVTQMTWGMDYIAAAYGDPCVAWNQHGGSY